MANKEPGSITHRCSTPDWRYDNHAERCLLRPIVAACSQLMQSSDELPTSSAQTTCRPFLPQDIQILFRHSAVVCAPCGGGTSPVMKVDRYHRGRNAEDEYAVVVPESLLAAADYHELAPRRASLSRRNMEGEGSPATRDGTTARSPS